MAFWYRINQSRLKHLTHQWKRYYTQVPSFSYGAAHTKIRTAEIPFSGTVKRPTDFCNNVRFFAAPFQVIISLSFRNIFSRSYMFCAIVLWVGAGIIWIHEIIPGYVFFSFFFDLCGFFFFCSDICYSGIVCFLGITNLCYFGVSLALCHWIWTLVIGVLCFHVVEILYVVLIFCALVVMYSLISGAAEEGREGW